MRHAKEVQAAQSPAKPAPAVVLQAGVQRSRSRRPPRPKPVAVSANPTLVSALRRFFGGKSAGTTVVQERALLARIASASNEGLVLYDADGRILYVNNVLCQLLDLRRREMLGKPAEQFLGDVVARSARAKRRSGNAVAVMHYEASLQAQSGRPLVVKVSAHRIESRHGRAVGCFAVISDYTMRSEAEAALRRSHSELRLLASQVLAAEELERKRIARELHDGIGQALGGIKFGLENCVALLGSGAVQDAGNNLRELVQRIKDAIHELRRVSMNLRPVVLEDLGLLAAVSWFTREFRSLHRGLKLELVVEVREFEIPKLAKEAIYRIVQEAFANVVNHAQARHVFLSLRRVGQYLELGIRDDGIGFDPARYAVVDAAGRGIGLASMRERATASGGRFQAESSAGRGTSIQVFWHCEGTA